MKSKQLNLEELEKFCLMLFKHFEDLEIRSIELDDDYYWTIYDSLEVYDPYNEPKKLALGQLYDDLDSIEKVVRGDSEIVGCGAVWLSSLLRYLGEKKPF